MINIAYLEITSFVGMCPDAVHYYGNLVYYKNDNREEFELKRIISKKESKLLNEKDGFMSRWRAGSCTGRFETKEEIIKLGKKIWKKESPESVILVLGRSVVADPQEVIAGDKIIKQKINKLYKRAHKIDYYEDDEKEMDIISYEFGKIVGYK